MCESGDDSDMLDIFLSAASEEVCDNSNRVLKDVDIFNSQSTIDVDLQSKNIQDAPAKLKIDNGNTRSIIHSGDTDSSDDEGNRNYENAKYNEYGTGIKKLLNNSNESSTSSPNFKKGQRVSWITNTNKHEELPKLTNTIQKPKIKISNQQKFDVDSDPFFGIRIVNPLISSAVLQDRMTNRDSVTFGQLSRYLQVKSKDKDWVIAGVVVNKSTVRTSQKGNQYLIWTLSDLKDDIKTVSMFLFGNAYHQLWKTAVGTVVGILNPSVLDKKEGTKDVACLSVDNAQRLMILGTSKDMGTCKSVKKNGDKCTAIVNISRCEFCIYHIKQEYQKCSIRSELQSNFSGKGLIALRNKVLGKNEVFYAGKSYMAIPAKKSKKLEQQDNDRMKSLLGNINTSSNNIVKAKNKRGPNKKQAAARLEISHAQRLRDLELLKKLGGLSDNIEDKNNFSGLRSTDVTLEESKTTALDVIKKLKERKTEEPKTLHAQYDLKSDLFVNVENKKSFTREMSNKVTLDDSKSAALSVITKLKEKQTSKTEEILHNELSKVAEEFFDEDDFDLSYNDDDDDDVDRNKSTEKPVSKKSKTDSNVTKKYNLNCDKISSYSNATAKEISEKHHKNQKIDTNTQKLNNQIIAPKIFSTAVPTLSKFKTINLNKLVTPKRLDRAKLNAIKLIQKNGPLKKEDPNNIKGSGKKRVNPETETILYRPEKVEQLNKLAESGFISDRFKKMMAATSSHADLLEQRDDEEQEKYFQKQEMKEQMEEKMATTFKVACKAVRCLKCKYTSFSASDLCKIERHPLRVFDTMKRFFKCGNCGNRTVSLEVIPTVPCRNCGSGKWEKTGMMKEKIVTAAHTLSIRGGEQKFVNSVVTEANLNLMMPDDN